MKLLQLFERSRPRLITLYHGTTDKFLNNILKHGLVINSPNKVYDYGDDDVGHKTVTPFEDRIYLTPLQNYAAQMAGNAAAKFGGEPIIVIVRVSREYGFVDEHALVHVLSEVMYSVYSKIYDAMEESGDVPVGGDIIVRAGDEAAKKEIVIGFKEKIKEYVGNLTQWDRAIKIINAIADELLDDDISVDEMEYYSMESGLRDYLTENPRFNDLISALSKNLRIYDDRDASVSRYIPSTIGFKGRNRIIRIVKKNNDAIYDSGLPIH